MTLARGVLSSLAALVVAGAPSGAAHARGLQQQLVGTWRLVSWTRVVDGVEQAGPFGSQPIGQHIFTSDGFFCVALMAADRPRFASPDPRAATPQERASGFDSYVSYCGRYEADDQDGSVLLRPHVSLFPNWTGTSLKRLAEVKGNRVTFRFQVPGSGGKGVVQLFVWERAS